MRGDAPSYADIEHDPFGERSVRPLRWRTRALGARFEFSSNSQELLDVAREAFAGVPQHRWRQGGRARALRVDLDLVADHRPESRTPPPKPKLSSGAGLLVGLVDDHSFLVVDPGAGRALLQLGRSRLLHRELVRQELIEFAAIQLATRTQALVSLHAGCVGWRGQGVLLLGSSGAGKSTLGLHAALAGLDFLAEDSVFVQPDTLLATGLGAFAHVRDDAARLFDGEPARLALSRAPHIQRRSGVRKRELDLRAGLVRLAPQPLRIVAAVALSSRRASGAARLKPLGPSQLRQVLRTEQAFALRQPGWQGFEQRVLGARGFRLDRAPPAEAVSCLRTLLGAGAR